MMRLRIAGLATLLMALGAVGLASAQEPDAPPNEGRLMEMFLDHATRELDLTTEQRTGLRRVLQETFARRALLAREARELRHGIQDALSDPETDDAAFQRLSAAILDLKRRELELLDWQRDRLAEVLRSRQALRFMLMQEQLAQRIESMRRDRPPR